ncbi:MAG TPA: MBOAT family O-acyltransferase, partial [Isosphaeraceae bacterium]|nr:MBOAT family O-acyltransferase [Isosphaeraceae bacterium]
LLRCDQAFRRRVGLVLTLAVNLTILGFFKYFNFFVDSAGALARSLGLSPPRLYLHLILPVGISFYTFQSLSYTIDVYRRRLEPVRRLADFALFVAFFPPLVAGPIERAAHMLPQLLRPRLITYEQMTRGAFLILHGMFKKVAVADGLAGSVSSIYNTSGATSWADIVAATVLFAFQIYCDFSGYSDIARGVAKFLGFELLVNFRLPYVSRSPSEFWQRWHISLSTWLRDYLYISLGGNGHGEWKTYRNLMVTMLLGGLWHGAAWNFVLWGLYQGAILCLYRLAAGGRPGDDEAGARQPLRAAAQVAVFFALTCYGWLLFRANSLGQVVGFTRVLLAGPFDAELHMMRPTLAAMLGLPFLIGYEAIEYAAGSPRFYQAPPRPVRGALYGLLVFLTLLGTSNEPTQFIYFQF